MDILKNYKSYDQLEKTGVNNSSYDSFWTLNDDSNSTSISTTSLSHDPDQLKFIDDEDDSESSSSDEIYSLETSMIEMQLSEDEKKLCDEKESEKDIINNNKYHHAPSPMVGRSVNFYNIDSFCDDAVAQLANKGFAQSINRMSFAQNLYNNGKTNSLLERKDIKSAQMNQNTIALSNKDSNLDNRRLLSKEKVGDWAFEFDALDNEDLMSLSSHGSDRSNTPVDTRNDKDQDETADSNLLDCRNKFSNSVNIKLVRPSILKFTAEEDIGTQTTPNDELDCYEPVIVDSTDDLEENEECEDLDVDDDDSSTICDGKINENEGNKKNKERDILAELYSENILFFKRPNEIDRSAARRLARRLFELDGFRMTDVAKHLSKRNDFSQLVGEEFSNFFNFTEQTIDSSLRQFLDRLILIGETQERERVIHHFSRRYLQCNPLAYNSEEACHNLVCALLLLNTDLHAGSNMVRKMTCDEFLISMNDLNNGTNFDPEELSCLFNVVVENPFRWSFDNELVGLVQPKLDYPDLSKQMTTNHFNLYFEVPSESTSREYMSGYLLRKCIKESHDRKTSIGKRGWKLYFGRLQDLTLHLYKDEMPLFVSPASSTTVMSTDSLKKQRRRNSSSSKRSKSKGKSSQSDSVNNGGNMLSTNQHNSYSEPVLTQVGTGDEVDSNNVWTNDSQTKKRKVRSFKLPSALTRPAFKKRNSVPVTRPTLNSINLNPQTLAQNTDNKKEQKQQPQQILPSNQSPLMPPQSPVVSSTMSMNSVVSDVQIYLNHAFATRANDYNKKRNVFRLQVSSGSEYLFQVNEPREVDLWVDCLNFVAALLSPPVFIFANPNNAQSNNTEPRKKSNPTLTSLNIKEQLESHQRCVITLEQDLMHLNASAISPMTECGSPPVASATLSTQKWDRLSKNNKWQLSRQRKFVERELIRYKTYCRLLEFELIHMHNMAIAAARPIPIDILNQSQQPQPYIIPINNNQHQQQTPTPLFYNHQTNQFVPFVPVFHYPPPNVQSNQYQGLPNNNNNSNNSHPMNNINQNSNTNNDLSIKELSEEPAVQTQEQPSEKSIPPPPQYILQPISTSNGYTNTNVNSSSSNNNKNYNRNQYLTNNSNLMNNRRRIRNHHHHRYQRHNNNINNQNNMLLQYPNLNCRNFTNTPNLMNINNNNNNGNANGVPSNGIGNIPIATNNPSNSVTNTISGSNFVDRTNVVEEAMIDVNNISSSNININGNKKPTIYEIL